MYPNSYYNYLKNRKSTYQQQKKKLQTEILSIYHENNGVYGYTMIRNILKLRGIHRSYLTIYRYMKELNLKSIIRRKRPDYVKGTAHKVFENVLNQEFHVTTQNKVWCTDFTYLPLENNTMEYNCSIIDLADRSCVATMTGDKIDAELAISTLKQALENRKHPRNIVLHSDQGSQYTSKKFVEFCEEHGIQQSMSRAGCPYDNAPMERFFNTLKHEFFHCYRFHTAEVLRDAVAEFVMVKYNYLRPHSYNGGLPPRRLR